jgi:diaminohydroxyphosphoribosylaminopyrimidine deaminase / 5-amino-6-(5-phosphoribosylamino)uracil reductase
MSVHEKYIHRCLELAKQGAGSVSPNPMVGAVLVNNDQIVGEGWHQHFGAAHAEVNAIKQAITSGFDLDDSTLYVSLEPCAHFGKTPPCTELIIEKKVPRVVIGCMDPNKEVMGKGIARLQEAGIIVEMADRLLQQACRELNKRFFSFHTQQRPYVILKWTQTSDEFIGPVRENGLNGKDRWLISNEFTNRIVHKWRSEEAAILVGKQTALSDDPQLTNRWWTGPSPVRMVVDMDLGLPASLKLLDGTARTVIFNSRKHEERDGLIYYQLKNRYPIIPQILQALYEMQLQSVLVEGGARLLESFIEDNAWDEIRIICNNEMKTGTGLPAPKPVGAILVHQEKYGSDTIGTWLPGRKDH